MMIFRKNIVGKYLSEWRVQSNNLGLSDREIFIFITLSFLSTATEVFGLGMFLPIFQFIRFKGDVDELVANSDVWQYIIDGFSYFNIAPSLLVLLLIAFGLFLARQFFTYTRLIYDTIISQRLIQLQRNRIFDGYIDANTSYHDRTPVGSVMNIILTEVNGAIVSIMLPMSMLVYVIMFSGYFSVLILLSWEMTIFSIVAFLIASMIPKSWINKSGTVGRKLVNANTLVSEFLVGRLKLPRLVRLSGTEDTEKSEFHKLTLRQRKNYISGTILKSKTETLMEPVVIGLSLVFLYFSYNMLQLQVEMIGLYLVIIMRLMPIVKSILLQIQSIKGLLGSSEMLKESLRVIEGSKEKNNGVKLISQLNREIALKHVDYHYEGRKVNVLQNITIEFEKNKITAIVGPSGSGKSTLIDLIPRLRKPTKGVIEINNLNIENYELRSFRNLISYASQVPQIFHGTVKNHILYGKKNATNQEVQEAIKLSGAEEFINKLPQGLDTVLGNDAVKLSGGQRQRLDLARVLVKKSPILILDEPTSNLDIESEKLFNMVLFNIMKNTDTTVIIVSHNLKSISDADKIIVLNKGSVESFGIHSDLLKQDGWYAKAWKSQE